LDKKKPHPILGSKKKGPNHLRSPRTGICPSGEVTVFKWAAVRGRCRLLPRETSGEEKTEYPTRRGKKKKKLEEAVRVSIFRGRKS